MVDLGGLYRGYKLKYGNSQTEVNYRCINFYNKVDKVLLHKEGNAPVSFGKGRYFTGRTFPRVTGDGWRVAGDGWWVTGDKLSGSQKYK